ncbi:uncharacterized protein PFL1_03716 [Pseudozyma flocculosa PF-1]|uniref:RNA polymerase II-associated protein 3 n=2 Tax=Pseudozyma flocculosa TaxID=84751 RepID=A0A5C3F298_9BASI|nr:uncharacterized protein PFL1_03716 [Pseudozyma flocculosa PF-1]EPQ28915.1 hypothetical protein PFL1_03716 [Pseudozyma flocculosa PF-1]SPO38598.1 uncharacterized protein PSFLO_04076 [Pseudozyma flocculosa]
MDKVKAQQEKAKGNSAFARGEWAIAVGHYAAAHLADPTEPTIPLNRAMAYLKLGKFHDAERDCTTALRLSPRNVKATFRRAKARLGAGNLVDAQMDFEQVLELDPRNNEAKAELVSLKATLEQSRPRRTTPLDLPQPPDIPIIGTPANSGQGSDQPGTAPGSSVEAARKFLQQVGMQDPIEADRHGPAPHPPAKIPHRLPGETGGFLREVASKRVVDKPAPTTPAQAPKASTSLITPLAEKDVDKTGNMPAPVSTAARKTASALSFGTAPVAADGAARLQGRQPAPLTSPSSTRRLNAVEFQRLWKESSRLGATAEQGAGAREQQIAQQQLRFLHSLEATTLPVAMDSLLEPELLASLLLSLDTSVRMIAQLDSGADANTRPVKLPSSADASRLLDVVRGLVTSLPRCKRFSMVVAMLDASEKRAASTLIHALEDNDALEPADVAKAHEAWEA